MGIPIVCPSPIGLQLQTPSQANSLSPVFKGQGTKLPILFLGFSKIPANLNWRHAHAWIQGRQSPPHAIHLSRNLYKVRQTNNCTTNPRGGREDLSMGIPIDNYIKNTLSLHSNGVFYSINGYTHCMPSVPPVPREEDATVGSEPQVTINETVYDQNPRPATRKSQVFRTPIK